jgi:hypothetical protein
VMFEVLEANDLPILTDSSPSTAMIRLNRFLDLLPVQLYLMSHEVVTKAEQVVY